MSTVNMLEAKTHLSRLVESLEAGAETEIIIARNGRPAARLVPIGRQAAGRRIGVARGEFTPPAPDDTLDEAVADLFHRDA